MVLAICRPSLLRACFRGVRVAFHLVRGTVLACFFPALSPHVQLRIQQRWSRQLLEVLHVGFEARGAAHPEHMQGQLLVANHVSWLDVLAMNAAVPACFVAKSEVRNWPLLGWLCHRVGTLFIKRDIRRDTVRINRKISARIAQGACVALFPEGTSSDGVLPGHFHSSLLQGVIDANGAIRPVAIRYHDGSGRPCVDAAFIGDMSFARSLWKILCSPSLHVTLFYLPPIPCAKKNRRLLAAEAQGSIHMVLAEFSPNHSVCVPCACSPNRLSAAAVPVHSGCLTNS